MSDISSAVVPALSALIFAMLIWRPKQGIGRAFFLPVLIVIIATGWFWVFRQPSLMVPLSQGPAYAVMIATGALLVLVIGLYARKLRQDGKL